MRKMPKPEHPYFSSGPCGKRKDWTPPIGKFAGHSHRSEEGLALVQDVIHLQKKVLEIPQNYYLGIMSASATGAMETLIWNLLGPNKIDVLAPCMFSNLWAHDIVQELKIKDVRVLKSEFGRLDHLKEMRSHADNVFCWTSTTSGVSVNSADWISKDREGLTICDAASAAFVSKLEWDKLDAVAFSWQKGLASEAGFGSIVLSPRAMKRLEAYTPTWPLPRIFRLKDDNKINYKIFDGYTINTPSMICLEEFYNNLVWAHEHGGINFLNARVEQNYSALRSWVQNQRIFKFLCEEKCRAHAVGCLDLCDEYYQRLSENEKWFFLKKIVKFCENEEVGFDFLGHTLTKPHLRIWLGPTIETSDILKFLSWMEYAYREVASGSSF